MKIIKPVVLIFLVSSLCAVIVFLVFEIYLRVKGEFAVKQFLIGEDRWWNKDMKEGKNFDLMLSNDAGLGWELRPKELQNGYGRFEKTRQIKPRNAFRIIAMGIL